MKFFLDTEFIEAPNHLDLISIGIVCESGETLYCESSEVDWSKASQWVLDNVRPHLSGHAATRQQIAESVVQFVRDNLGDGDKPEFWGYYADYDWVAICWLFGTMMDLPKGWPMYCRDLKQWADMLGNPTLPEQGKGEHHALADAHWNYAAWRFLRDLQGAEAVSDDIVGRLENAREEMKDRSRIGTPCPITAQTIANIIYDAAAEIERLREDNDSLQAVFDLRWEADMRATKRWHEAGNPTTVWPDHADMVVWLLEQLTAAEAQRAALAGTLRYLRAQAANGTLHPQVVIQNADAALAAAAGAGADDGGEA